MAALLPLALPLPLPRRALHLGCAAACCHATRLPPPVAAAAATAAVRPVAASVLPSKTVVCNHHSTVRCTSRHAVAAPQGERRRRRQGALCGSMAAAALTAAAAAASPPSRRQLLRCGLGSPLTARGVGASWLAGGGGAVGPSLTASYPTPTTPTAAMSTTSAVPGGDPAGSPTGTIVVYVTVPNAEVGEALAGKLVSARLAACVNMLPGVTSIYWWKGKVEKDPELLLIIKSRTELLPRLTTFVRENHPYDEPEVVALPILGGSPSYLQWLMNSTAGAGELAEAAEGQVGGEAGATGCEAKGSV